MKPADSLTWSPVCSLDEILPDTGVCALVRGKPIAVFHVRNVPQPLFAIDNVDPNSGASVLSRGLVGNLGERIVVASPIYKHHFDLRSGECLEAPEHSVAAYAVKVEDRTVLVSI